MRRPFHGFVITFSIGIIVFSAALWIRSYWVSERLHWNSRDFKAMHEIGVSRGTFCLDFDRAGPNGGFYMSSHGFSRIPWAPEDLMSARYQAGAPTLDCKLAGFRILAYHEAWGSKRDVFFVPCWFVCLVAMAILLRSAAIRRRLARKHLNGARCHQCGHDLRATPDRCPECGASAKSLKLNPSKLDKSPV
ncbi:MAG TPA: hypothetical protein VGQ99_02245 [Tepidisphaeraceae bacterium]|nr:hypothetical protein [Tepidisphaeraceae bacterium]